MAFDDHSGKGRSVDEAAHQPNEPPVRAMDQLFLWRVLVISRDQLGFWRGMLDLGFRRARSFCGGAGPPRHFREPIFQTGTNMARFIDGNERVALPALADINLQTVIRHISVAGPQSRVILDDLVDRLRRIAATRPRNGGRILVCQSRHNRLLQQVSVMRGEFRMIAPMFPPMLSISAIVVARRVRAMPMCRFGTRREIDLRRGGRTVMAKNKIEKSMRLRSATETESAQKNQERQDDAILDHGRLQTLTDTFSRG